MAKFNKGILGGFSGRIGNVVGSNIFGIDVMRSYQPNVANPRTTGQVSQRTKFSLVVQFLRQFNHVLSIGFKLRAVNMSAFNAAVATNLSAAVTGTAPDFSIDLPNLEIAQGALPGPTNANIAAAANTAISFNWSENNVLNLTDSGDKVFALVYNKTKDQFMASIEEATRANKTLEIYPDDTVWEANDEIHAWMFLASADRSKISDSVYIGSSLLSA